MKKVAGIAVAIVWMMVCAVSLSLDAQASVNRIDDFFLGYSDYGYYGDYADTPTVLLHRKQGMHLVAVDAEDKTKVEDYKLSGGKIVSVKSVKLPQYDMFGGFYHGKKDRNYVVVGYNNDKESDSKVVIKVLQYDRNWKKMKTANIKGGVRNYNKGIYEPFMGGTVSVAEDDHGIMYLYTARTMYEQADGLHHQSNIGFSIDTQSMKAVECNLSFCSHSFNQIARIADGKIYLADHGDGYQRGINFVSDSAYDSEGAEYGTRYVPFKFRGKSGENYTGASLGGMELSKDNVLITGASVPHDKAIAGITGYKRSLGSNLYLIIQDKDGGGSSFKWLTKNNPKTTDIEVFTVAMVKITDSKFAILYNTDEMNGNTHKYAGYMKLVDEDGNVLSTKRINDGFFPQEQPILYKNHIVWTQSVYTTVLDPKAVDVYSVPIK